jgi:hypothetical protein
MSFCADERLKAIDEGIYTPRNPTKLVLSKVNKIWKKNSSVFGWSLRMMSTAHFHVPLKARRK